MPASTASSTPSRQAAALLLRGPFARYMLGEGISMTGTWMQLMAQSWVMTTLTNSAMMLGMVNFAAGIPMIALSMLGGSAADRGDKRTILLVTQVIQIAFALLVGRLVATGQIQIWHLLAVAFLLGISNAFEMPAAAALVPELVGKEQVATAIAVDRAVFHGTRLLGPALAGFVIGVWSEAAAFYLNALSYVALIIALLTLHPRARGTEAEESQRRSGFREGLAYVRADAPTLAMIALLAFTTVFVFPILVVMMPLYAKNQLHLGPDKMGLLMSITGVGSFTGSVGLLAVRRLTRRPLMIGAVFGICVALVGMSVARQFGFAAPCLILLSLCASTIIGLANTVVQERAPGPLRGRVSAIAGLSFVGLLPFAGLGITSIADWLGLRTALLISAGAYFIGALIVLRRAGGAVGEEPPAG